MRKIIKVIFKVVKIGLILWLLVLSPVIILALTMGFFEITSPSPPQPVITYGEFPFRLEYDVNGEIFVIEDVYKIKYKGIGLTGVGKTLNWKSRFKSTRNEYISLYKAPSGKEIVLYAPIGLLTGSVVKKTIPNIIIFQEYSNGAKNWTTLSEESLGENFGKNFDFEIIYYEEAATINNEYVDKNKQDLIVLILKVILLISLLVWIRKIWKRKNINIRTLVDKQINKGTGFLPVIFLLFKKQKNKS